MRILILLLCHLLLLLKVVAEDVFVVAPLTTGINRTTGARPFRKDVTTLTGPELDLYILALQHMQQASQSEKLSWFQIAGIHGCPPIPWDGVPSWPGALLHDHPGYAVHDCGLFLPWHRAYLLLLENIISRTALEIAQSYPDLVKLRYVDAANSLRLPYWKWDGLSAVVPEIMMSKNITVTTPNGVQSIKNPLESYAFHPAMTTNETFGYEIFLNRSTKAMSAETVRCPDGNGQSDYNCVQKSISNHYRNLRNALYTSYTDKTEDFAAWAFTGEPDRSVEGIHGNIHQAIGGDFGFMTFLPGSAMDPIFFLHHVNVDRQWEIWEAIHQNQSIVGNNCLATFAQPPGFQNESSPLYPFHSDAVGSFHTPKSMRYTRDLGYAYEEAPDWQFQTPEELTLHVLQHVASAFQVAGQEKLATSESEAYNNTINHPRKRWWVDISLHVGAGQSATVYFFFGEPPAQQSQWTTEQNMILSHSFLADTNARSRSARMVLTPYLIEAVQQGKLSDLDDTCINAFLKEQLRWRVWFRENSVLTTDISVRVVDQAVLCVEENGLIEYGQVQLHQDLTWGRFEES